MRRILLSVVLGALAASGAAAQPPDSLKAGRVVPPVQAVRTADAIVVDGELNEAVWKTAVPVTDFLQSDPTEGAAATERTEVRVAYDDEALYVAARMFDTHADSIVARLCRRDVSIQADRFTLFIDPYHDRRSGFYFAINAAGVLSDGTLFNDSWDDNSWDAVWNAHARVDREGWTAEMRIPYSQLRFPRQQRYVWGIDFRRQITRKSETDFLVYPPKNASGFVSRFPDLEGLDGVRQGGAIELLPYMTGKAEYLQHDAIDPFNDGSRYKPSGGGDLRMGVGGKLTLNATVNPDFGQVEVDPAVVNLSDVESYFQEKRPFFVENSRTFSFGNEGANDYWGFNWPEPTFFYSRRIGRTPQGAAPDDAEFVDSPLATHILGAAKLTGKISPTWNFGTLHALTAKEMAKFDVAGVRDRAEVEPRTYYGVARGLREFPGGRNGFGLMSTLVHRHFDQEVLRDQLNANSVTSGIDGWHFLDAKKVWVVSGWAVASNVSGSRERITALQEGSRHYFQRPDAGYLHVDSSATSLTGFGARAWLNKQSGEHGIFNAALGFMDPKFDVNDMGFQSRADVINGHIGTGYKWSNLTKWRKYANVLAAVFDSHDFGGDRVQSGAWVHGEIEFINNYSWNMNLAYNPSAMGIRTTRGGPAVRTSPGYETVFYFDTDGKSKQFYFVDAYSYFTEAGSEDFYINPSIELKPISNLLFSIGPKYERNIEDRHYITTVDDPLATATYGQRYTFAALDQTTLSANIRLNWSFTPNLSLQTYIQPLISSGRYHDYATLARPRTREFTPAVLNGDALDPDGAGPAPAYAIDDPNFNFKSIRGNAVLRWEYMPGSAAFLVWTQERTDDSGTGSFDFQRSLDHLVEAKPNNIFLAKLTYYFNL